MHSETTHRLLKMTANPHQKIPVDISDNSKLYLSIILKGDKKLEDRTAIKKTPDESGDRLIIKVRQKMEKEYSERCRNVKYHSIQIHPEHGAYLLGARYGASIEYDPFAVMDQILYALLCIGYCFRRGEEISNKVQRFCSRYGMLGFEKSEVQKRYEDNSVKLYSGNVLNAKALTKQQQEQVFRPFQRELYLQRRRKKPNRKFGQQDNSSNAPILFDLDYEQCEAVVWYGRYGQRLLECLEQYQRGT